MAFLPGLFWGWLYSRHRTLIGVTISHILIGAWIFYFVGVHGILL
jgi:membrane protease YdiL (CAAX protease family)